MEPTGTESNNSPNPKKTSSGLDENVAGLLCYLLGFITGIIFLITEKENRFVRFHAMQSIFIFGGLAILNIVLTFIPFIGGIISFFIGPISLILWILLMIQAFRGELYKLPYIGDLALKQLK
ncbi:DUF4870 domain-containing protein [Metabacillus fastidiosus]|uniref:DUF4870 domain-containing protein n=1 Tax=Metabacillus fastidiosus TaxID=1458 RepID=UPI002DBE79DE|nr:DUF4870 domain-containing protein [Metabacillus fastidiosus]MEC2074537.1 DUF4870 domain-containing protein [Metabacillus fastidiosus]